MQALLPGSAMAKQNFLMSEGQEHMKWGRMKVWGRGGNGGLEFSA